jgi:hypothetical protein
MERSERFSTLLHPRLRGPLVFSPWYQHPEKGWSGDARELPEDSTADAADRDVDWSDPRAVAGSAWYATYAESVRAAIEAAACAEGIRLVEVAAPCRCLRVFYSSDYMEGCVEGCMRG